MATKDPVGISNETSRSTARRVVPLWYSLVNSRATSMRMASIRSEGRVAALMLVLLTACGGGAADAPKGAPSTPSESTTAATGDTTGVTDSGELRVLFLGTSLTAGLGLDPDSAFPMVIQRMADSAGFKISVVNAGLSGETSAGALRRADWLLKDRADVVVIETGANDGLRGLDPDTTEANLVAIIGKVRARHPAARILLAQMEAPPNLGAEYTRSFRGAFGRVAAAQGVTLIPFFLDGVAADPRYNQDDGIHPNEEGARRAARNVWKVLAPVIDPQPKKG